MKRFIARTLYNQRVEDVYVNDDIQLHINDDIIIQTYKGFELAKVKSTPTSTDEEGEYFYVRKAEPEDFHAYIHVSQLNKKIRPQVIRIIAQHRLAMNVVITEY